MNLRTIFTKWTAVPAVILLLGIAGTLFSWQALTESESASLVASTAVAKAETNLETRQRQLGFAKTSYDDNVRSVLNCYLMFGRFDSICDMQEGWLEEAETNMHAAEGRFQGATSSVRETQNVAEVAIATLETSRFYFFGVLSLTVVALLGFIATAIVTRRRGN
jgi:hypothetical protein